MAIANLPQGLLEVRLKVEELIKNYFEVLDLGLKRNKDVTKEEGGINGILPRGATVVGMPEKDW